MEVKVDPDRVKDLYRTLFDERNSAEQMTQKLIQCKHALEEQGLEDSSLSDVFHLLDTLINLMELLGDNFATLQQNATAIAEEFSTLDQSLSYRYGNHITTQSYQAYEQDRLNKMYRGY